MRAAVKSFISEWVLPPKVLHYLKNPRRVGTRYSGSYNPVAGKFLDQIIEPLVPAKGFYVDVGANDGVRGSNTRYFEQQGWRGVLIEPIMHQYFACRRSRSTETNAIVNAACVPPTHKDRFLELVYSDTMTVSAGVPGAEAHAKKGIGFAHSGEDVVRFCAPAMTLSDILDKAGAPSRIDLLSLDVEGGELGVLQGADLSRYRFGVMVIESNNVAPISDYLAQHGYESKGAISERDWLFTPVSRA